MILSLYTLVLSILISIPCLLETYTSNLDIKHFYLFLFLIFNLYFHMLTLFNKNLPAYLVLSLYYMIILSRMWIKFTCLIGYNCLDCLFKNSRILIMYDIASIIILFQRNNYSPGVSYKHMWFPLINICGSLLWRINQIIYSHIHSCFDTPSCIASYGLLYSRVSQYLDNFQYNLKLIMGLNSVNLFK